MSKKQNNKMNQIDGWAENVSMAQATGDINRAHTQFMLRQELSRLSNGKHAAKAHLINQNRLGPRAKAVELGLVGSKKLPHFDPRSGIFFGPCVKTGAPVGVQYKSASKHITILGTTGSGKSNADGPLILSQCPDDVMFHFFDVKGEAGRLAKHFPGGFVGPASKIFTNLMSTFGNIAKSLMARLQKLAPILKILATTWPAGAQILAQVSETKPEGEADLSLDQNISVLSGLGGGKSSKFTTLAERLQILGNVVGPEVSRVRSGPDLAKHFKWIGYDFSSSSILDCNAWLACYLDCLVQKLAHEGHSGSLSHIVVIDEVLNFFSRETAGGKSGSGYVPYQRTASAQFRSFGVCLVVCCQYPSQAEQSVLSNSDAIIVMKLPSPAEARIASHLLCGSDHLVEQIKNLKPGFAFFRSSLFPDPVLIKMPYFDLGSYPSASEIEIMMEPEVEWMRQNSTLSPEVKPSAPTLTYADAFPSSSSETQESTIPKLIEDEIMFLQDVPANPSIGVKARYKGLGISADKGKRIRNALLDQGLIEVMKSRTSGRSAMHLKLTEKGQELLNGLS